MGNISGASRISVTKGLSDLREENLVRILNRNIQVRIK